MALDIAQHDTICALSTAQGYGAIALVRASGKKAEAIFHQIFRKHRGAIKPLMAMHGMVVDEDEHPIDDVMALLFEEGKSFTGEQSFEIHCHGNQLIVDQILQSICAQGARLAEPGEFALRAMLNGKIDLAQAESIADLIHAKSHAAKKAALKGLQGGLKEKTYQVRESIIFSLAEMEARMDFPDEDLGSYRSDHLLAVIDRAIDSLNALLKNASYALRLQEGVRIVICGLPNAGKSTLLNCLLNEERAIVHETAGTTRDVIEASFVLEEIPVTLVDIAGIRAQHEASAIEKIGIERAFKELKKAHLVIWLADATRNAPFSDEVLKNALDDVEVEVLKVLNKVELLENTPFDDDVLKISAKKTIGISELKAQLHKRLVTKDADLSEVFITRLRQRDELKEAVSALEEARLALKKGMVDEVITSELRRSGQAFDRLFGTDLSEDILDRIFSEFCIGK